MNPKPEDLPPRRKKWWQTESHEEGTATTLDPPRQGESCPKCQMADLDFDTLFRLHCPVCGFVASCGAFT
jgi:hypothetical protein